MFIELKGEWWNVDQIIKIEPYRQQGAGPQPVSEIIYTVTLSSGQQRGITEEEFKRIMNISNNNQ